MPRLARLADLLDVRERPLSAVILMPHLPTYMMMMRMIMIGSKTLLKSHLSSGFDNTDGNVAFLFNETCHHITGNFQHFCSKILNKDSVSSLSVSE